MDQATDPPSERVAALMAKAHGDLSDAAEQLAALIAAASAELLDVIRAIDAKQSWRDDGATSVTAWVVAMLRVSHATAKEWVRVASRGNPPGPAGPRLRGRPLTVHLLVNGQSSSAMRLAARDRPN